MDSDGEILSGHDQIHIAVAFDRNYYNQFFALAASLFHHHSRGVLTWHLIVTDIDATDGEFIRNYVNAKGSEINFYHINDSGLKDLVLLSKWTSAVYYRLYFPFLLPKAVGRFLYLDVDIVVVNSLYKLWDIDLSAYPVAAVYDNYVKKQPLIGIHEEGEYFNSGVLLFNRKLWNDQRISEKAIEYLKTNPSKIQYVDQCGLNAVLYKNWLKLHPHFNFMYSSVPPTASMRNLKTLVKDLVIVHFTLQRPWHMLCKNRLAYLYFYYLKMSPIEITSYFQDYSMVKLPAYIKMKLLYIYFDWPILKRIWNLIKSANRKTEFLTFNRNEFKGK